MVTINDKLSLIIDVNHLFNLRDEDVSDVLNGDTYKIDMTYIRMLEIFRENQDCNFVHAIRDTVSSLRVYMAQYGYNSNDAMNVVIFLRYATAVLKLW